MRRDRGGAPLADQRGRGGGQRRGVVENPDSGLRR